MNITSIDAWTRRASLTAMRTAALAALVPPITSEARKHRRKKRRNTGDVNKLCRKQVGQCVDISAPDCGDEPACLADVDRCCSLLGTCDFAGAIACFEALDAARSQIIRPRSTR